MKNFDEHKLSRRVLLKSATTSVAALNLFPDILSAAESLPIKRKIPSTGEELPVVGMGSFITFDAGDDPAKLNELASVLQLFFDSGGQLIDTSSSYGNAESVLGEALKNVTQKNKLFAATKVRIEGRDAGIKQMNESLQKMGVAVMDLMQIHNLEDWKVHLHTLRDWKDQGKIRYIGITTSGTREYQHEEFAQVMQNEPVDFAQFTYNLEDRAMEKRILPIARDKGIATLINVPFGRGRLFAKVKGQTVPDWAAEFDCSSWAQFFLKYIISHPQVTSVIPATSKTRHMTDNMAAGYGRLPDPDTRTRMETFYASL
jgi:aryl-alcohol dehydrogenase-like predicted oxidoreductase